MSDYLHVFLTGERHTQESLAFGDAAERGWIDPNFSRRVFFDSRNDGGSVLSIRLDDEELAERVTDTLAEYLGAYVDNGDGTFYGVDGSDNYETGDHFTYALHFVRKDSNYVEHDWHPSEANISV